MAELFQICDERDSSCSIRLLFIGDVVSDNGLC
jgi:hypothetical protein